MSAAAAQSLGSPAQVTFSAPGTYVLRAYADEGILVASKDVTVTVAAAAAR